MSPVRVRAARPADEEAILGLALGEMELQGRSDRHFRLRADARDRYALYLRGRSRDLDAAVFVAEDAGRVIGSVVASVHVSDGFWERRRFGSVSDLVVEAAARRRGAGRALWEHATRWLRGLGVDAVRVHVISGNTAARAFWARMGATDVLVEAWIDLPPAAPPGPAAGGDDADEDAGDGGEEDGT